MPSPLHYNKLVIFKDKNGGRITADDIDPDETKFVSIEWVQRLIDNGELMIVKAVIARPVDKPTLKYIRLPWEA